MDFCKGQITLRESIFKIEETRTGTNIDQGNNHMIYEEHDMNTMPPQIYDTTNID